MGEKQLWELEYEAMLEEQQQQQDLESMWIDLGGEG